MAQLQVKVPENSQNIEGIVTLSASLEKVFEAHTDPELFAQWWCRGNPMKVFRFDCRDGGGWHIAELAEDKVEHEFYGVFHEVSPDERIVQTFEYMGMPERGHVLLEKSEFRAIDNNTTEIRSVSTAQSIEGRDGMVASGMEDGWRQSIDALGKLLED